MEQKTKRRGVVYYNCLNTLLGVTWGSKPDIYGHIVDNYNRFVHQIRVEAEREVRKYEQTLSQANLLVFSHQVVSW